MDFNLAVEKENQQLVLQAIQAGFIESAHDCSEGGLAVALAEAAFGRELGIEVSLDFATSYLFSETQSRFVVSVKPENQEAFEKMANMKAEYIGITTADAVLTIQTKDERLEIETLKAKKLWEEAIPCLMK